MTKQMKDSGVEWIGKIPMSWETRRLKVALEKEKEIVDKYNGENILSLTMNGVIVRDLINPKGKMPTTFDGYQKISKGNLITCLFDIDVTPRCVGIAYNDGLTSPAYTQYNVKNNFNLDFIYYYLLMLDNDKILVPITKSLRNTIKSEDFLNLELSFPDFYSQKRISEYITLGIIKINQIISESQQSIEELKKYKKSLIAEVVTKGLNKNVEMKESGVEWIGKTPNNWTKSKLKVALVKEKEIVDEYNGENILSLTMNGVIVRDLVNPKGKMPTTFDGYQKISKGNLITCLFDIDVTPRCVGIAYNEGLTSPAYTQYKVKNDFDTEFIYYYLLMLDNDKILVPITKSLRNTIKSEDFLDLEFSFPSKDEQKRIVDYLNKNLNKVDTLILEKEQVIQELEQYKKSLIYEYVTGKKEV